MDEEEKSIELLVSEALDAARKAFQDYFEKRGMEPARFDYRFTAWLVDENFVHRLARIEIEREVKEKNE